MSTWAEYKDYVKSIDSDAGRDIDEAGEVADIVTAMIRQRNALGLSQRDLAKMCGMPQSSVARIESYKTMPKLETLMKVLQPLGLKLSVTAVQN